MWGDEFNSGKINNNIWQYGTTYDQVPDDNVYYNKDLVQVDDSGEVVFTIEYKDEKFYHPPDLHTKSTMNYKFGYIEMRAKLPFAKNAWSAFWMQSIVDNEGTLAKTDKTVYNSYKSEIDVFETFGSPDSFVSNLHKWYKVKSGETEITYDEQLTKYHRYEYVFDQKEKSEYHIIGMEWTDKYIKMFLDGVPVPFGCFNYSDFDTSSLRFEGGATFLGSGAGYQGFLEPLLVSIGTAVANADQPDMNNLPNEYRIDWIRLYQKNPVKNSTIWTR